MTLKELYIYAEDREIEVDDVPMRELVSSSFPENWIAIDTRKIRTRAEEKVTLAHEVGHCETGSFYNVHSPLDLRGKHERRANVWSYKNLIPHEELLAAVKKGITEIWELAEYFDVTCEFMQKAAEYWRQVEMAV